MEEIGKEKSEGAGVEIRFKMEFKLRPDRFFQSPLVSVGMLCFSSMFEVVAKKKAPCAMTFAPGANVKPLEFA